jgi:hypothetical protein
MMDGYIDEGALVPLSFSSSFLNHLKPPLRTAFQDFFHSLKKYVASLDSKSLDSLPLFYLLSDTDHFLKEDERLCDFKTRKVFYIYIKLSEKGGLKKGKSLDVIKGKLSVDAILDFSKGKRMDFFILKEMVWAYLERRKFEILNLFENEAKHYESLLTDSSQKEFMKDDLFHAFKYFEALGHSGMMPTYFSSYLYPLELALNELLTNAIWNADPRKRNLDRSVSLHLSAKEQVSLSFYFNERFFILFGQFPKEAFYDLMEFCFDSKRHLAPTLKEKAGGGIGLQLLLSRLHNLHVICKEGVSCEMFVVVDISKPYKVLQSLEPTLSFIEV